MSADLLRQAAALMRERAEAATPGPWEFYQGDVHASHGIGECVAEAGLATADSRHIASWHPAVALAVADWLYAAWVAWERDESSLGARSVRAMSGGTNDPDPHAIAVARAYLGSP